MNNIHTLTNIAIKVSESYGEKIDWGAASFRVFQIPAISGTHSDELKSVTAYLEAYLTAYAAEMLATGKSDPESDWTWLEFERLARRLAINAQR